MSPSLKAIEAILSRIMQRMVDAFNSRGSCSPLVAVMVVDELGGTSLRGIPHNNHFFADEAGKQALSEFCRAALNSDQAVTGIAGVVICHEAWLTNVSPDNAGEIQRPSQSPDRQEALCAGVYLRGAKTYSHMLIADAKTRQVEFAPYVHDASATQIWSRFSSDADPDADQDDPVQASPTYH